MSLAYLFLFSLLTISCSADATAGPYVWYDSVRGRPYTVTYDDRSFIIDGQRTLLLGGEVHYPRFATYQWHDVLTKMKADGLNHIQMYVFWNLHEHDYNISSGEHTYDFTGRADIAKFLTTAAEVGLFVNLRIGPYVCAEWSYGGLPVWLRDIPGIKFRDYNQPWMDQMATFVKAIGEVAMPFLAKNGGPIILAQIENEYGGSQEYVDWCGQLAESLDFQVPWVMCGGASANNTVNTHNGVDGARDYAEYHEQKFPHQPLAWTENEGWLQMWALEPHTTWDDRTPEDMANVIAKWFAVGAAHHNYYMYFGGNHIGSWAASGMTNMYADGVNYHSDTTPNEPKRSHLNRLHQLLISYNDALMATPKQLHNATKLNVAGAAVAMGTECDAKNTAQEIIMDCAQGLSQCTVRSGSQCLEGAPNAFPVAFTQCDAANKYQFFDWNSDSRQLNNSASNQCLDLDVKGLNLNMFTCKNSSEADNQHWTYLIDGQTHRLQSDVSNTCVTATTPQISAYSYGEGSRRIVFLVNTYTQDYSVAWEGQSYSIPKQSVTILDHQGSELYQTAKVNTAGVPTQRVYVTLLNSSDLTWEAYTEIHDYDDVVYFPGPQEQLSITHDKTDYLVYITSTECGKAEWKFNITLESRVSMAVLLFIDGVYKGQAYNPYKSHANATLVFDFEASVLSVNSKVLEIALVSISLGLDNVFENQQGPEAQDQKGIVGVARMDGKLLNRRWGHRAQINGERMQIYTPEKTNSVNWTAVPDPQSIPALTWFRTRFDRPNNMKSDDVIVLQFAPEGFNEFSRGHFYLNGVDLGRYWGISSNSKIVQNSYFIPNDLIQDKDNLLVYLDECGATHPSIVSLASTHMEVPKEMRTGPFGESEEFLKIITQSI